MTENNPQFIPLYPLNSAIFSRIRENLPEEMKKDNPDVYYQLQLQSLLYVSFNRYLTGMILELPETDSQKLVNDLMAITTEPEFTQSLAFELNKPIEQIIHNYLALIAQANKKIAK